MSQSYPSTPASYPLSHAQRNALSKDAEDDILVQAAEVISQRRKAQISKSLGPPDKVESLQKTDEKGELLEVPASVKIGSSSSSLGDLPTQQGIKMEAGYAPTDGKAKHKSWLARKLSSFKRSLRNCF